MKRNQILATDIRFAHPNRRGHATDYYYTHLANLLMDSFGHLGITHDEHTTGIMRYAAITLASYMEDIVADSGQWRMFTHRCQEMFGWPVPVYHDAAEEYYADEPSRMAVRFMIWHAATEVSGNWWYPTDDTLAQLSDTAYELLSSEFVKAPINQQLREDVDSLLREAESDFNALRMALAWLFSHSYLIRCHDSERLIMQQIDDAIQMGESMDERSMWMYHALMNSIFAYRVGPLALLAKDYLASMAMVKGKMEMAHSLADMVVAPIDTYQYHVDADRPTLSLTSMDGRLLVVSRDELAMSDDQLLHHDGCVGSFVNYRGVWYANGVMSLLEDTQKVWKQNGLSVDGESRQKADIDWLLRQTHGEQLFFFGGRKELLDFMSQTLMLDATSAETKAETDDIGEQPVMLFIDTADTHNPLRLSFGINSYVCAPSNPYYDAEKAKTEAISLLWQDHLVSSSTLLYLLDHGYLPDLLSHRLIGSPGNPCEQTANARFLLRYMRKNNY